jgi:3-oxoacyl-[acyl-carrier-protein] synthase II
VNLEDPDPACALDFVPRVSRPAPLRCALSNSYGFGGNNTTVVFGRA